MANTEKFTFEANVIGVEEYTVVWKLEEGYGQINENTGEYTAPPVGVTDDVISAQVVGFPDAKDYAKVRVGACVCAYNISIIGAGNLSAEGGDIAYLFSDLPDGFHTYTFFVQLDDPSIPEDVGVGMTLGPTEDGGVAPRPGVIGTYDLQMSFFNGFGSWTSGGEGGRYDHRYSGTHGHLHDCEHLRRPVAG